MIVRKSCAVRNTLAHVEYDRLPGEARPAARPDGQDNRCSHFDIYWTERVAFTSELFGGGDWHWRLTGPTGTVLADCGGYRSKQDCLAAIQSLRTEALNATMPQPT